MWMVELLHHVISKQKIPRQVQGRLSAEDYEEIIY